jgi:alkylated DNA repair dioxygenase AlkB
VHLKQILILSVINRYSGGNDNIGEHREIERELDADTPIASLSLGCIENISATIWRFERNENTEQVTRKL